MFDTAIHPQLELPETWAHYPADTFPTIHPIHWLTSHFAVGGWSPLQRLSGMLTAHMTSIAPHNGFTWHPHRGLEIYTWVLDGTVYHEDTTGGKGFIGAGEIQRMFSGTYIEHQELNLKDDPARVIQIWYIANPKYMGLEPHYQQVGSSDLPTRRVADGTVHDLIGGESPLESHMFGRLTATTVTPGGLTTIEPPDEDEDLFLYVVDGAGEVRNGHTDSLGLYDVILATPDIDEDVVIAASGEEPVHFMNFYLPRFIA